MLSLVLLLFGCATTKHQHQTQLVNINQWKVTGVISINHDNKNDVAYFNWQQSQDNYTLDLHGPMNLGSVHIAGNKQRTILQQTKNQQIIARTPENLIYRQFGWFLPISNLKYWIFASPAPCKAKALQFDTYNHLIQFTQQGWQINYSNFIALKNIDLPSKIEIKNSKLKIKIIIKTWIINS